MDALYHLFRCFAMLFNLAIGTEFMRQGYWGSAVLMILGAGAFLASITSRRPTTNRDD